MATDRNGVTLHVDDVVLVPAIVREVEEGKLSLQLNEHSAPAALVIPAGCVRVSDQVTADRNGVLSGPT